MRRWLKYGGIVFVILLGMVLAATWLLGTPGGTRWLLRGISYWASVDIKAEKITGRLLDDLHLEGVRVGWPEGEIEIDQLLIRWHPAYLLAGRITFSDLTLERVRISDLRPQKSGPSEITLPKIRILPAGLHLEIRSLKLKKLNYRQGDQNDVTVEDLSAHLSLYQNKVRIENLALRTPLGLGQGKGELNFSRPSIDLYLLYTPREAILGLNRLSLDLKLGPGRGPEQMAGTMVFVGKSEAIERVLLKGELGLSSKGISLTNLILSQPGRPGTIRLDGQIDLTQKDPLTQLHLKLKDIDLSKEVVLKTALSGDLSIEGNFSKYRGRFSMTNSGETWHAVQLSGAFQGDLGSIHLSGLEGALLDGNLKGEINASWSKGIFMTGKLRGRDFNPNRITPDWSGKINLDLKVDLRWPESDPPEGKIEALLLESRLRGKALTGKIDAQLDRGIFRLTKADLHGKGFDLSAQGTPQEGLHFEARVSDLSGLIPGVQGSFQGKGWAQWRENQLTGVLTGQGRDLSVDKIKIASLEVTARLGEKEKGNIDLKAAAKRLVYDTIRTDSVALSVTGTLSRHNFEMEARWPDGDARGTLEGAYSNQSWEGTLSRLSGNYPRGRPWSLGSPASVSVSPKTLKLMDLVLSTKTGEKVKISADLGLNPLSGFLDAEWEQFDLALLSPWLKRSSLLGHTTGRLRNQWLGEERIRLNGQVSMEGSFQDDSLRLERIRGKAKLDWDEKGLKASYEANLADTGELHGEFASPSPGRFALPEEGKVRFFWKAVDLDLFKQWLPKDLGLKGQASGHLLGEWTKRGQLNTEGEMEVSRGTLKWKAREGPIQSSLERAELNWSWRGSDLQGKFLFALAEYGEIKGRFRLPVKACLPLAFQKEEPVELALKARIEEKGLLPVLSPKVIQESWGGIDLDLNAHGTWGKPRVEGTIRLKKAGLRIIPGPSTLQSKNHLSGPPTNQKGLQPLRLEVPRGWAKLNWGEKGLQASYEMELAEGGKLEGRISSSEPAQFAFPENGRLEATFQEIDLRLLRSWLPSELDFNSHLSGNLNGEWLARHRLKMKADLKASPGDLSWKDANGQINAKLKEADARLDWHGEELKGDLSVVLEKYGQIKGNFKLPLAASFTPEFREEGPLHFALQGQIQENGLLTTLFPGFIQESRGQLDLSLVAAGTWGKPQAEGRLKLAGAGAYLPTAGIRLEDVVLEAGIVKDQIQIINFRSRSGPGHIEGTAKIFMKDWKVSRFQGSLRGDRFQIIYLPDLQVLCTPRLEIEGTLEHLKVRGEIHLPEFTVLGRQAKDVVRSSKDVVIVDRKERAEQTSALPLDAEIRIMLGDKVFVRAEGIDARMAGNFTLRMEPFKAVVAAGEIQVVQGNYTIYGRKLDITRGRLLFSGPMDNPSIDVLAVRKVKGDTRWEEQMREVQAGVVVTGYIQSPLVRLYSQPSMPEVDILSYIILGQPMSRINSQSQLTTLFNAASFLFSAGESALLKNKLSSQTGLDALDIRVKSTESQGSAGSTGSGDLSRSLVTVGMYLDPRLYAGIGGSLFSKSYQVILRYSLTKHIEVETKAGTESGANIYYKVEFE
jgi:translocation and assembly module TamB